MMDYINEVAKYCLFSLPQQTIILNKFKDRATNFCSNVDLCSNVESECLNGFRVKICIHVTTTTTAPNSHRTSTVILILTLVQCNYAATLQVEIGSLMFPLDCIERNTKEKLFKPISKPNKASTTSSVILWNVKN